MILLRKIRKVIFHFELLSYILDLTALGKKFVTPGMLLLNIDRSPISLAFCFVLYYMEALPLNTVQTTHF